MKYTLLSRYARFEGGVYKSYPPGTPVELSSTELAKVASHATPYPTPQPSVDFPSPRVPQRGESMSYSPAYFDTRSPALGHTPDTDDTDE